MGERVLSPSPPHARRCSQAQTAGFLGQTGSLLELTRLVILWGSRSEPLLYINIHVWPLLDQRQLQQAQLPSLR